MPLENGPRQNSEKEIPAPEYNFEEGMGKIITDFINRTPEYADRHFTPEEIADATKLLANAEVSGPDDEIAKKALDARLAVRRIKKEGEHETI